MTKMSAARNESDRDEAPELTLAQVGMWLFITTEVMMFAAFFSVAVIFRFAAVESGWPAPASMHVSLGLGILNTVILLTSGVFAFAAARAARQNKVMTARLLVTVTLLLGCAFLYVKFTEYQKKAQLGLFPSASRQQIWQEADKHYLSAVDLRLQELIAESERERIEAGLPLDAPRSPELEQIYKLRESMSDYVAQRVGRGLDPYLADSQVDLMSYQILSDYLTARMEEAFKIELEGLTLFRSASEKRLEVIERRLPLLERQVREAEAALADEQLLGAGDADEATAEEDTPSESAATQDDVTADAVGEGLEQLDDPAVWLKVKQDQLRDIRVEKDRLEVALKPVRGRMDLLESLAEDEYEAGFNEAFGLRLPVVVENGLAWMSVYLLLTGTHVVHLIGGMLVLLWLLPRRLDARRADSLFVTAMYWQFVDVVWIGIFAVTYF